MGSQVTEQLHRDTGIFIGVLAQSGVTVKVIYPSGLKSSHRMAQGEKKQLARNYITTLCFGLQTAVRF